MTFKEKLNQNGFIRKLVERRGTLVWDDSKCVYCGKCKKRCDMKAIVVNAKEKLRQINHNLCVRCGHCIKDCPKLALAMEK